MFLQLTQEDQMSLIQKLQTMRNSLVSNARTKRLLKTRKKNPPKKIAFKSEEHEKIFNLLSPEMRKLLQ